MKVLCRILILGGVALAAGQAWAQRVAVFPPQATHMSATEREVVGVLLAAACAEVLGAEVFWPSQVAAAAKAAGLDPTAAPAQVAQALGAHEYVTVAAIRLEARQLLRAVRFDAQGDELLSARASVMAQGELPPAAHELAVGLFGEPGVAASEPSRSGGARTWPQRFFGVKTQMLVAVADGARFDPALGVQFNARFEGERYFFEFGGGVMAPTTAWIGARQYGGVTSELGASAIVWGEDISIYFGGGLAPRLLAGTNDEVALRLAVFGHAGVLFFRDSGMRLFGEVRLGQNVLPYRPRRLIPGVSGEASEWRVREFFPSELVLCLGLGI
jgi:hypothetical protein